MSVLAFDTEIYKDYFLVSFMNVETGNSRSFELHADCQLDISTIRQVVSQNTLISFNGINFDIPILTYALLGANNEKIKALCDYIIVGGYKPWHCETAFKFKISQKIDHIDLIEVANGKGSLKAYGGRLHSKKIQDLPIQPSDSILPEQRQLMRQYCGNDLQTTMDLYNKLKPQIKLREEMSKLYGIDLRSKSDAQIAEHVIKSEVEKIRGCSLKKPEGTPKPFRYRKLDFIIFETELLKNLLSIATSVAFIVTDGGKTLLPKELSEANITIGKSTYTIGIGGLHSNESSVSYKTEGDWIVSDHDVVSYYPSIILGQGLYPAIIGKDFLKVYKKIVEERIAAKASGDKIKSEALKVTINGSFGKFGNKYSYLFSPDLLIQTTITGQLALLMLIEQLELAGISVVSANTDGIVIYYHKKDQNTVNNIIAGWELTTGFETEETLYKAIYSRDINNYIAIKEGGIKLKGAYAPPEPVGSSWPNPHGQVCVKAITEFLTKGTPVDKTISECSDIKQFVFTRMVKGGAVKNDDYLGRIVRWYYSHLAFGEINYKINGYKVPKTEGAMPCMTLPDKLPDDIDLGWYVEESEKILKEIGYA